MQDSGGTLVRGFSIGILNSSQILTNLLQRFLNKENNWGQIGSLGIIYYVSAIYNLTNLVRLFSDLEKTNFNPPDCCATAYKETYKHPSQTGWSAQEVHWINKFSVDALPSLTLILMTIQAGTAQLFKPWSCRGFLLRNSVRSRYIQPRTFWIRGIWRKTKFRFYTITVFYSVFYFPGFLDDLYFPARLIQKFSWV